MGNPAGETTGHPTFWRLTILMPYSSTFSAIFSDKCADIFPGAAERGCVDRRNGGIWRPLNKLRVRQKKAVATQKTRAAFLTDSLIQKLANAPSPSPLAAIRPLE